MVGRLDESINILTAAFERSTSAVVAFSGGKESLVCLDLALRTFKKVEAFHMWFVPDLEIDRAQLEAAEKRWRVKVRAYPHPGLLNCLRNGTYRNSHLALDELPEWSFRDVYDAAKADSGCDLIITGKRRADSMARRRSMGNTAAAWPDEVNPLAGWQKIDVLSYLARKAIPLPPSSGAASSGIGLETRSLLWLRDNFPEDFKRICEYFPYAEAAFWRREFYEPRSGADSS